MNARPNSSSYFGRQKLRCVVTDNAILTNTNNNTPKWRITVGLQLGD